MPGEPCDTEPRPFQDGRCRKRVSRQRMVARDHGTGSPARHSARWLTGPVATEVSHGVPKEFLHFTRISEETRNITEKFAESQEMQRADKYAEGSQLLSNESSASIDGCPWDWRLSEELLKCAP